MDRNEPIRPQQKVCETNVDVPTILVEPLHEGGDPAIFVQWFGEAASGMNLEGMQFRFPVPAPLDSPEWMGHPERCKVIMLGPTKIWPSAADAQRFADTVSKGDLSAPIIFLVATHYSRICGNGRNGPACFMIPMKIALADGVCGVISPRPYCEPSVLAEEMRRVGDDLIDRNDFAEQLGDDF